MTERQSGSLLFGYLPTDPPAALPRSPNGALGRAAAGGGPVDAHFIDKAVERGFRGLDTSILRGKIAAAVSGENVDLPSGVDATLLRDLSAEQADLDAIEVELRGAIGEMMVPLDGLDVEDLSYIVKRIGRNSNITKRFDELKPNTIASPGFGRSLVVVEERLRLLLLHEVSLHLFDGGSLDVARACLAAARDPRARKAASGITQPSTPERVDALLGIGNALLDAHRRQDEKNKPRLQHGKLGRPTSRLTDDGKRVMLEWGTYSLEKLEASGVLDAGDKFNEVFDRMLDEVVEEFKKVTDNAAVDNPDPVFAEQARVWIQSAPAIGFRWALSGFPFVVPSHKLAASLMATYLPPEHAAELKLPWDTFFVAVPNGMFEDDDPKMLPRMVGITNDSTGNDGMRLVVVLAAGAMLRLETIESLSELTDFEPNVSDYVAKFMPMLARLVLGCIIEMDHPERKAEISERESARDADEQKSKRGKKSQPTAWAFELKRDVRVDLRDWVREQVASGASGGGGSGKRKLPAVRILVRGHHKRQRYGIGGLLRMWIHIEPYWRNLDAAVIGVRSHVLKSGRDK